MKKYLALVLSMMLALSMSMTVCAASSPSASGSSNHKSSSKSSSSSSSSTSTSTKSSTKTSEDKKAAKDAEVQKKVLPNQAVVMNGQVVEASVKVASTTEETNASFGIAAQYFTASPNAVITDTFSVNVGGLEASAAPVSMVFTVANLPANFLVVVQDAAGNWTCITPELVVGNSMLLTIPASSNIAIVTVPAA